MVPLLYQHKTCVFHLCRYATHHDYLQALVLTQPYFKNAASQTSLTLQQQTTIVELITTTIVHIFLLYK